MRKIYLLLFLLLFFNGAARAQSLNESSLTKFVTTLPNPNVCDQNDKKQALIFVKGDGQYKCVGGTYVQLLAVNDSSIAAAKQTKQIADYSSLSAAQSAIGSSVDTPLEVPTAINVNSSMTLSKNIRLKFAANGMATIASGQTLTIINGAGLQAPATRRIFSGAGKVVFTGSYPEVFYPEWFGAVGDGVTDDLPAFDRCLAAMQIAGFQYRGGIIKLNPAAKYFLGGTLHIRVPVTIDGGGVGMNYFSGATLIFPPNTRGIINHSYNSFYGDVSGPKNAQNSKLKGVALIGAMGGTNAVGSFNGSNDFVLTLSSGLTFLSRLGGNDQFGATFGAHQAVYPGTTVTINGFDYLCDAASYEGYIHNTSTLDSNRNKILLRPPRFFVGGVDGNPRALDLNFEYGLKLPTTGDWDGKTLTDQQGDNYIIQKIENVDKDGVVNGTGGNLHSRITLTSDLLPGGGGSVTIGGIKPLTNVPVRINIYHGIDEVIRMDLENVVISGFAGNGVAFNSERPVGNQALGVYAFSRNSNNAQVHHVDSRNNAGSGFVANGDDSNNINFDFINMEGAGGAGVYSNSSFGNNYTNFHANENMQGAFQLPYVTGRDTLTNGYIEGGQAKSIINSSTQVIGGDYSSNGLYEIFDFINGGSGVLTSGLSTPGGITFERKKGKWFNYNGYPNTVGVGAKLGAQGRFANELLSFGSSDEYVANNAQSAETSALVPEPGKLAYILSYGNVKPRWYSLSHTASGDMNFIEQHTPLSISGYGAAEGANQLWLHFGFFAGLESQGTRRKFNFVSSIPTTGATALGDIFWSNAAGVGVTQPLGWVTSTAGTIGSGAVLTPIMNQSTGGATVMPFGQFGIGGDVNLVSSVVTNIPFPNSYISDRVAVDGTDNTKLIAGEAGLYEVTFSGTFADAAPGRRTLVIFKNGTAIGDQDVFSTGSGYVTSRVTAIVGAAVGEYFQIGALQDSGGTIALKNVSFSGSLTIRKIRDL